jgi:molybdopterin adenylyltransferase
MTDEIARIGIVTVSDRAARGEYEDKGGPAIVDELAKILESDWEAVEAVIPDEPQAIRETLIDFADNEGCCLIVTTGGTGPAARDLTPDITEEVCERMMPGFGELMRAESLKVVPTAILSRQTAGLRGKSLIINLPGNPPAIHDCLMAVFPAVPYCIDLLGGPYLVTDDSYCNAFRPKHARRG